MGYLACPVCERQSLADVSDLQQRVAAALNRPLLCPICSASVHGIQAFHNHLAIHLPVQHKAYPDGSQATSPPTPSSLVVPQYPITSSPETIPTLERLDINDSRNSPFNSNATLLHKDGREAVGELSDTTEPESPFSLKSLSSQNRLSQPYNCDLCGLVFSSEHFLKFHKDIIHSRKDFFDVTCKLCKEKFKDFEAYRNHVRESHSDRRYICDQCPKTFKMKGSLLVHTRMFHDPSSPGTCQLCKKTFTTKARKELHEKRYHGVGLEHIPSGKTSPPSPSVKQQKTKISSLGDAKNWLETLMTENKPAVEENINYRDMQDQQKQQQMLHVSQQTTAMYSSQINQSHPTHNFQGNQTMQKGTSHTANHHQDNPLHQKETQEQESQKSNQMQQIEKSQQTDPSSEQQNKWDTEYHHNVNAQDKVTLAKISPDLYYQQHKFCINLPNHVTQQTCNPFRSHLDQNDFKPEKKISIIPYTGESSNYRPIGTNYSQQSPVAIVSPQPQKSETPPSGNQNNESPSCHLEARRNSFPQMNMNKLCMSQTDKHSPSYISELSLNASTAISLPSNQNFGISTAGEKIQNTLAVSQQLVYQHSQTIIPTMNSNISLVGADSKVGVRVSPLFISNTSAAPKETVKEPPDSPVQMMQLQEECCTSEIGGEDDITDTKVPHDFSQEHRGESSQIKHQRASAAISVAACITRKDSNGKMDAKQWECDVCKKSFTTKYFLKKHKRLHTGETPYACAECGKTFTFQQSYHKHILYHSDDKPHQCSFCGRAFKEMSTLHNHVRIHTGEKPFVCETCGKAFRQRVSYLVHQRIHTGVMPYTCDTCGRSFRYKVSLRSHKCEPCVSSSSNTTISGPSTTNGRCEVSATETRKQSNIMHTTMAVPASVSNIVLLPAATIPTTNTVQDGAVTCGNEVAMSEEGQRMHVLALPPTSSNVNNLPENEDSSFANSTRRHQQPQHCHIQRHMQGQQEDLSEKHRHQEGLNGSLGRNKAALETIDMSAISCDSLQSQNEVKKSHIRSNKSPNSVSPRAGGVSGLPGMTAYHDPLSMAFLHALVDPHQGGRMHGECRPHVQMPQDGLPFPSLSPGAMDTDIDHDNFLTNLLM
ncbi:hypothetical protein SK128_002723 [Halocaridina rubra]|uniref:C2H2-type domain-containing protein n=1 Tax=Halocaridina rubra TaxID=373956 RepID=A0AAN8X1R3_HALRR